MTISNMEFGEWWMEVKCDDIKELDQLLSKAILILEPLHRNSAMTAPQYESGCEAVEAIKTAQRILGTRVRKKDVDDGR